MTLLDTTALQELIGDRPERVRQFLYQFLESTATDMRQVDDALQRQDGARLKELGHRIKSPAAMVGALAFAALCHDLEVDAGEGAYAVVAQMHVMLDELASEVRRRFA
jgi:HPt (histidine-containing phosphotransfer) domain-containing protein